MPTPSLTGADQPGDERAVPLRVDRRLAADEAPGGDDRASRARGGSQSIPESITAMLTGASAGSCVQASIGVVLRQIPLPRHERVVRNEGEAARPEPLDVPHAGETCQRCAATVPSTANARSGARLSICVPPRQGQSVPDRLRLRPGREPDCVPGRAARGRGDQRNVAAAIPIAARVISRSPRTSLSPSARGRGDLPPRGGRSRSPVGCTTTANAPSAAGARRAVGSHVPVAPSFSIIGVVDVARDPGDRDRGSRARSGRMSAQCA